MTDFQTNTSIRKQDSFPRLSWIALSLMMAGGILLWVSWNLDYPIPLFANIIGGLLLSLVPGITGIHYIWSAKTMDEADPWFILIVVVVCSLISTGYCVLREWALLLMVIQVFAIFCILFWKNPNP